MQRKGVVVSPTLPGDPLVTQALNLHLLIINQDGSYFKVQATHLPTSGEEVQWHAFYYNGEHYEVVIKQEL